MYWLWCRHSLHHPFLSVAQKITALMYFAGAPICKDMFLVLYGIGKRRYENLKRHYKEHGIFPRSHGNKGKMPVGTCSIYLFIYLRPKTYYTRQEKDII